MRRLLRETGTRAPAAPASQVLAHFGPNRLLRDFQAPIEIVVVSQSFAERYWDIPGTVLYPAFKEGKVLYG